MRWAELAIFAISVHRMLCGLLFRLTNPPPQNIHKNFDINRLGNMVVHPPAVSLSDIGGECIGRQGQDWNGAGILPFQGPDHFRCPVSIHHWHLYIHQNTGILSGSGGFKFVDCDGTIFRRIDQEAVRFQQFDCDFTIELIVLCQQELLTVQGGI